MAESVTFASQDIVVLNYLLEGRLSDNNEGKTEDGLTVSHTMH